MTRLPSPPPSPWWDAPPAILSRPAGALDEERSPLGPVALHVVIGAGIAGVSLADALAREADGDGVVLLDAARPGHGATGRNAGFLLAESDCFELAVRRHGAHVARALRDIGLATRRRVDALVRAGHDVGFERTGSVRLAFGDEEASAFRATAARRLAGVALEDPRTTPERGGLTGVLAALVDARDGVLDPLRLLAALLAEAQARGVVSRSGASVHAVERRGAAWQVHTDAGTIRTETVTFATASATSAWLPASALPGVRPVRAQMLAARLEPAPTWTRPVYAFQGGDYWRLLPDGRLLLGGRRRVHRRREETPSARATSAVQGELDVLLRQLLPDATGIRIDVTHRWAGTMTFTADGLPVAGSVDRRRERAARAGETGRTAGTRRAGHGPGRYVLTGLNGHGMGWAPGLARALAREMVTGEPCLPVPFRPRSSAP